MLVLVDPVNIEACHWFKQNNKDMKAILKLSRVKELEEILMLRSKLKIFRNSYPGLHK